MSAMGQAPFRQATQDAVHEKKYLLAFVDRHRITLGELSVRCLLYPRYPMSHAPVSLFEPADWRRVAGEEIFLLLLLYVFLTLCELYLDQIPPHACIGRYNTSHRGT